jgi:hypothetical protein
MRRLAATLAGLALALTLSGPAWANEDPSSRSSHHSRFSGRSDSGADSRPYGDKTQHDDPSILF